MKVNSFSKNCSTQNVEAAVDEKLELVVFVFVFYKQNCNKLNNNRLKYILLDVCEALFLKLSQYIRSKGVKRLTLQLADND